MKALRRDEGDRGREVADARLGRPGPQEDLKWVTLKALSREGTWPACFRGLFWLIC